MSQREKEKKSAVWCAVPRSMCYFYQHHLRSFFEGLNLRVAILVTGVPTPMSTETLHTRGPGGGLECACWVGQGEHGVPQCTQALQPVEAAASTLKPDGAQWLLGLAFRVSMGRSRASHTLVTRLVVPPVDHQGAPWQRAQPQEASPQWELCPPIGPTQNGIPPRPSPLFNHSQFHSCSLVSPGPPPGLSSQMQGPQAPDTSAWCSGHVADRNPTGGPEVAALGGHLRRGCRAEGEMAGGS